MISANNLGFRGTADPDQGNYVAELTDFERQLEHSQKHLHYGLKCPSYYASSIRTTPTNLGKFRARLNCLRIPCQLALHLAAPLKVQHQPQSGLFRLQHLPAAHRIAKLYIPTSLKQLTNRGHSGHSLESRTYSLKSIAQATTMGTSVSGLVNRP